jgi:prenyl protein peptidase
MPLVFPFPPLSTTFAHLLSLSFTCAYVGSIYLSKNSRLSFSSKVVHTSNGQARPKEQDERWRDDPDVIKARLAAVGSATLVCCLGVIGVVGCFVGDVKNVSYVSHVGRRCYLSLVDVNLEHLDHTGVFLYTIGSDIR